MYTSNRIDLILHNHRNQKENALQLCESLSTDRIIYKAKFIFILLAKEASHSSPTICGDDSRDYDGVEDEFKC